MASLLNKSNNPSTKPDKGPNSFSCSYSKDIVICMIENGLCKKEEISGELVHFAKVFQELMDGTRRS